MTEKTFLQHHFNTLFRHLRLLIYKANKLLKSDLISICVINDIFVFRKSDIGIIFKNTTNTHKRDVMKPISENYPDFGYSLIVEQ